MVDKHVLTSDEYELFNKCNRVKVWYLKYNNSIIDYLSGRGLINSSREKNSSNNTTAF